MPLPYRTAGNKKPALAGCELRSGARSLRGRLTVGVPAHYEHRDDSYECRSANNTSNDRLAMDSKVDGTDEAQRSNYGPGDQAANALHEDKVVDPALLCPTVFGFRFSLRDNPIHQVRPALVQLLQQSNREDWAVTVVLCNLNLVSLVVLRSDLSVLSHVARRRLQWPRVPHRLQRGHLQRGWRHPA